MVLRIPREIGLPRVLRSATCQGFHVIAVSWLTAVIIMVLTSCSGQAPPGFPGSKPSKPKGTPVVEATTLPEKSDGETVNSLVARMSDEQVRRLLIDELKKSAVVSEKSKPTQFSAFSRMVRKAHGAATVLQDRIQMLRSGAEAAPDFLPETYVHLKTQGEFDSGRFLRQFFLILAIGIAAEWIIMRRGRKARDQIYRTEPTSLFGQSKCLIWGALVELASILVFCAAIFGVFLAHHDDAGFGRMLILSFLAVVFLVRGIGVISSAVLAPKAPALRLISLKDSTASHVHKWVVGFAVVCGVGMLTCGFMELERAREGLVILTGSLAGLIMLVMAYGLLWHHRRTITEAIRNEVTCSPGESRTFRGKVADLWSVFVVPYLFVLWLLWVLHLLLGRADLVAPLLVLWLSVPLYLSINGVLQRLLDATFCVAVDADGYIPGAKSGEKGDIPGESPPIGMRMQRYLDVNRYVPILRRFLSFSLVAALLFQVLEFWGIEVEAGRKVSSATLEVSVAIILASVVWKIMEKAINRRLAEIQPAETGDDDHEAGGRGGSRLGTLLVLLRRFILAGLLSVLVLILMSAVGINVAPLLAGAGVIGLAIGFGSQTLVKDIVSGIFYLVDDAFRIGDYVDTGRVKGTVEYISIRSVRLRHHRGMVHTIPFSSLGAVTNYSRDYIIDKIDFGVPYDADVNKIKKIVKQIDKELSEDDEFGPRLLAPIKSQGVKMMDDSALIMRIKCKTLPGEQFIIRREIYARLKKAFDAAGIEFAVRQVLVRMPGDAAAGGRSEADAPPSSESIRAGKQALGAGAAAAITTALAEEEALKTQEEDKKKV